MTFQNKELEFLARADTADNVSSKAWHQGLITARALQSKQFKPLRIILPKLIPEGLTLLAGKPKVGKSWLALDVCLAVADKSRFVFGDTRPVHGNALYLALEDNERRLHWRIKKIVQGQPQWPEWLDLRTEWRRVDEGGLEDIEAWCESVKQPRLIWIDTLPKIRPLGLKGREQAYAADYRAMEGLQALAGRRQLGIVVNAHLRKAASEDDPIDDINGTLGLSGAADTAIVLKRQSGMVKIYLRGRDIEEAELAAEFNRETCRWRIVGGAEEAFRSQERQAVIAALKEAGTDKTGKPNAMTLDDILAATERSDRGALRSLLHKMRKDHQVVGPRVGYHALPGDPLNSVDAVDGVASEPVGDDQSIDNTTVSETALRQRGRQRGVNGNESVDGALTGPENAKCLDGNENPGQRQRVNGVNGVEHSEPTATVPSHDDDPIPVPKHRCDHCGSATGITYPYDWEGRPDGIRLHRQCEAPWFDSFRPALVCDSPDDFK
jgi:AAA domain